MEQHRYTNNWCIGTDVQWNTMLIYYCVTLTALHRQNTIIFFKCNLWLYKKYSLDVHRSLELSRIFFLELFYYSSYFINA